MQGDDSKTLSNRINAVKMQNSLITLCFKRLAIINPLTLMNKILTMVVKIQVLMHKTPVLPLKIQVLMHKTPVLPLKFTVLMHEILVLRFKFPLLKHKIPVLPIKLPRNCHNELGALNKFSKYQLNYCHCNLKL